MDLDKVNRFPYILDEWNRHVKEMPEWKFTYDGVATNGRRRSEVDDEASRVYAYLKGKGIGKEDFVMICMPRCVQVVSAILGVLKAGAAFTVVDSHYADERIDYIYRDCECRARIDLDTWAKAMEQEPLAGYEPTDPHDACFAVYTSGSTGNPKGVIHEYGKLKMIQLTAIKPYVDAWNAGGCRFGLIPPLNFVAALKFIVHGIYTGMRIFIIPTETIKNPRKLKQDYLAHKITDAHMAPSVIRAAGDDFGPYLKRVITGSEPPNGISLKSADLINNYTMSESAFVVAQYRIEEKGEHIPIGVPNFEEIRIRLLDEEGKEVGDGEVGEICFENPYFRKYNNLPEATEEALRGGLFHTGDLGRKLEDGNYAIAGRINDMIKINGNRVEPAEIERHAKEILGIDWCVAKGFVDQDKAFLCLYYTDDLEFDVVEVKEKFGAVLPYYMVPTYYVKLDEVPLLPTGKINKKVLPKPDTSSYRAEYVAPRNDLEAKICKGIEEVLHIKRVGVRDDFFELGGDSLSAMELLVYLDWEQLSSTDIYTGITSERIAAIYTKRITAASMMSPEEYEMEARKVPHRLTPTQVYMLDSSLFKPKYSTWNLQTLFRIEDKGNIQRLTDAVNEVIRNAPICSTMIYFDDDCELRQRYVPEKCPVVEIEHVTDEEFEEIRKGLGTHTDIINTHLYQFRMFETESCGYLFINRHHIATDGMAKSILYRRIADAYEGKPLPLDTYYTTIQRWEESGEADGFEKDEQYVMERYGNTDWAYELAHDYELEEKGTGTCALPADVTQEEVAAFEKNTGVTRNQLFNICMLLALARCTGRKDVLMAYAFHNRTDQASNEAIGGLYMMLPLGAKLGVCRNLAEHYDDIRAQSIGNVQRGNHNWSDLLVPGRLREVHSLFYETERIMGSAGSFRKIGMKELPVEYSETLFSPNHLCGVVLDKTAGFTLVMIYQSNLYRQETVQKMLNSFNAFASVLVAAEDPAGVSIPDLFAEVDEKLAAMPEPTGAENAGRINKRFLMGDD